VIRRKIRTIPSVQYTARLNYEEINMCGQVNFKYMNAEEEVIQSESRATPFEKCESKQDKEQESID
jgi:hypothetical protein